MKKFKIIIEETCTKEFTIQANDEDEVYKIAKEKYYNGELVLDPGELVNTCMAMVDENGETYTNFMDF